MLRLTLICDQLFLGNTLRFNVVLFVVPRTSDDEWLPVSQPKKAVHENKTANPYKASPSNSCYS